MPSYFDEIKVLEGEDVTKNIKYLDIKLKLYKIKYSDSTRNYIATGRDKDYNGVDILYEWVYD